MRNRFDEKWDNSPPVGYAYETSAWIGLRSVLRPRQHSIGYMGDGFYRSKTVSKY